MATRKVPYTRYLCPCTDLETPLSVCNGSSDADDEAEKGEEGGINNTLNPHSSRADFHLYPLEHLVFCNECYELRCPRCYYEEALQYYCPSCLFETQSSIVKCETNKCTRSCFQCPICLASLQVSSFQDQGEARPESSDSVSARDGPCILSCPWCSWTSLEIGIVFEKPVNISGQLAKIKNGESLEDSPNSPIEKPNSVSEIGSVDPEQSIQDQYAQLASFYKNQITETTPSGPFGLNHNYGLDSPNTLSRLLSTYGLPGLRKHREKLPLMREALYESEGLRIHTKRDTEQDIISHMQTVGWDGIASVQQVEHQPNPIRFLSNVRPISTKLRSRRAKRCRTCRYNLVKPEEKRGKFRYQIKLVALNFIPTITAKPLDPNLHVKALTPYKSTQFLLTFRNPLFDTLKVTLATSRITPGRIASSVTILCPEFEVGANTDVWEDALDTTTHERNKAREALEGTQPEAGRVWEKGRNWTSIIVEVTPSSLDKPTMTLQDDTVDDQVDSDLERRRKTINDSDIEIPLYVRLEHEADDTGGDTLDKDTSNANAKDRKIKRELSYWCVLTVGTVSNLLS